MKPLILDFLHRWRWLFGIALLLSAVSSIAGLPFIVAPAAIVALLFDAQRGVFRAVRPLPVSRLDQAKAWWVVGVPLLPLLCVPMIGIGILIFQQFHPDARPAESGPFVTPAAEFSPPIEKPADPMPGTSAPLPEHRIIAPPKAPGKKPATPWFAAGVQTWVALGYAGICFFLMQWAPTHPPQNLAKAVQQGLFGLLWGISMPGIVFLFPNLPRTPDAVATWHWVIFVAVPVFVALSYFSAAELVRRRMFVIAVKSKPQAVAGSACVSGGLTGIPLFVVNFAGRVVMLVILIACVQIVVLRWMTLGNAPGHNPALGMQVSLMGMIFGAVIAESIGMRALRTLPLSTPKLALLLALIPWAGAFTSAVFSAVVCGAGDPALPVWLNLAAQSIALCGWVTLAYAVTMHISSGGRLFVLMLLVMIPGITLQFAIRYTVPFAMIGSIAGVAGFALLVRGLRKSSAFYRPRGFFGLTPGQPSAVR